MSEFSTQFRHDPHSDFKLSIMLNAKTPLPCHVVNAVDCVVAQSGRPFSVQFSNGDIQKRSVLAQLYVDSVRVMDQIADYGETVEFLGWPAGDFRNFRAFAFREFDLKKEVAASSSSSSSSLSSKATKGDDDDANGSTLDGGIGQIFVRVLEWNRAAKQPAKREVAKLQEVRPGKETTAALTGGGGSTAAATAGTGVILGLKKIPIAAVASDQLVQSPTYVVCSGTAGRTIGVVGVRYNLLGTRPIAATSTAANDLEYVDTD